MKNILGILLLMLFLPSCKIIKSISWIKSGKVQQKKFLEEVSFENRSGYIIIAVEIAGNSYDFLMDTGAPNVISKELAEEFKLKNGFTNNIIDVNGTVRQERFVKIPQLKIGEIDFKNTGAVVIDLNANETLACFEIDGLLGSNLMRELIWQFDFFKGKVRFTDQVESLKLDREKVQGIPFWAGMDGIPKIGVKINGETAYYGVTVDFGSSGGITVSRETLSKLDTRNIQLVRSIGTGGIGLYNETQMDTIDYAVVSSLEMGEIKIRNALVEFTSNNESLTLGTAFFQNYVTTLDWDTQQILLEQGSEYGQDHFSNFGIHWVINDHKLVVAQLFNDSKAFKQGIRLGNQILEMNGQNVEKVSNEQWCELFKQDLGDSLRLKVLQDGVAKDFLLVKEEVF